MYSRYWRGNAPRCATLLVAVSFLWLSSAQATTFIEVPAGNSQALVEAFEAANQSEDVTTIQLDGGSEYRFDLTAASPPLITSEVVLIGDGARIVGDGPGSIRAYGHYQSEGVLVPGGAPDVNTDELLDWGDVWITLFDCNEGRFTYDSVLPQFGSGSFTIKRLASVDALGCANPPSTN